MADAGNAAGGGGVAPPSPPARKTSLIEIAFPTQATLVFFTALAIGLTLIVATTIFRNHFAINGLQTNLVLCVGVALILSAFGGQATVQIGSFILAGVAAVAIGLFAYLQNISARQLLTGEIRALDLERFQEVTISNQNPLVGVQRPNANNLKRSRFSFMILRDELHNDLLDVVLINRSDKREIALVVPVSEIEWAFSDPRSLVWELRTPDAGSPDTLAVFDVFTNKFVSRNQEASLPSPVRWAWDFPLVGSAHAQGNPPPPSVRPLLDQLRSDDTTLRRAARDALAAVDVAALPEVIEEFRKEYDDYRVRLGICVALTQMLRADKGKAALVSGKLSEDDLRFLIRAAADSDRTVRIYATEFLFDLGDPRVSKMAITDAATTTDDNARYNWLFIAQDGWRKLSAAEKNELAKHLAKAKQQSGPRTLELFGKLGN
jgi:hypothetical protein